MLFCKNCCWSQKSYLFSSHNGLKGGSHGNFSFSISYITTNKTIHWNWPFHILFNFLSYCNLIRSIFVWECCFKGGLPFRFLWECKTNRCLTTGIKVNQFLGQIFYRLFYFTFSIFPGFTANSVQARLFTFVSNITLNQVNLFNRNKGNLIISIFKLDIVTFISHGLYSFNSMEKSNTPVNMYNIVTWI